MLELAEATLTRLDFEGIEMKGEHFRATVEILAGGHGLPILKLLHTKGWSIASDVATDLDIHTTTASKYLTKLYEVGILDRRTRSCRTRKAYEYKLRSPRISLDLDIRDNQEDDLIPVCEFYSSVLFEMIGKTEKIGWAIIYPAAEEALSELLDSSEQKVSDILTYIDIRGGSASTSRQLREAIESGELQCTLMDLKRAFTAVFERVLSLCSEGVGSRTAGRIFRLSLKKAPKSASNVAMEYGLLDVFPEEIAHAEA
jgi:predicted ArsR family transcriptional regulator